MRSLPSQWEALSRYGRNGLYDGAVFATAIGELDLTLNSCAAESQTCDVWRSHLFYASRRDGYAQTRADETHDRQPLRRLLHNMRAKAVFFAKRNRLFIGEGPCRWSEEDEGFIAKFSR